MPLDEPTRRQAFLLQRDLRRQTEREKSRSERGEEVRYDPITRMAIWETRRGDVIGRWYAEVIASYVPADRILRWAWAGQASLSTATHADAIFREAQARNVPQLGMSVVGDLDEEDACTLARIGVILAKGEGLELRRADGEVSLVGLFDSPRPRGESVSDSSRYSVPPPAVSTRMSSSPSGTQGERRVGSTPPSVKPRSSPPARRRSTPPPAAPYRSLPPIQEIFEPRERARDARKGEAPPSTSNTRGVEGARGRDTESRPPVVMSPSEPPGKKIREPARALFVPVATAVLAILTKAVPRFQQALFVVTVHSSAQIGEKRRLVVTLVAVDEGGILRALDPSSDLVDVAARMVEADRIDGNGPWRKLSARITPKTDGGATLNVDVI
jgi:hypothetical protein